MNASSSKRVLKTSYRASPRSLRPLYTGGPVLLTKDGQWLITTIGEEVLITEVSTGLAIGRVKGDGSNISSLALSYHTSPPILVTSHMSFTIRYYPLPYFVPSTIDPPSLTYSRQLSRAHSAPILVSAVSPDDTLFASGSSDGIVKVWDLEGGYVTHIFRGHGGPVSALHFSFPDDPSDEKRRMELFTGSTDTMVRVYDLRDASARTTSGGSAAKSRAVLEGHVSVVRGIDVSENGRWAVTGGRDKVVLVWDLTGESNKDKKGKSKAGPTVVQTIIVQEQVEALGLLPAGSIVTGKGKGRLLCYTAGDRELIRVWDVLKGEEVVTMRGSEGVDEAEVDEDEQRGVLSVLYDSTAQALVSVHADQNIIFHSLSSGTPMRHIVGFNDEIIDAGLLSSPYSSSFTHSHLALATNSNLVRIYSTATFDGRLLSGHKDMVLCLDTSADHHWLVTGSKDRTSRIWAPCKVDEQTEWRCIAICEGHAEPIGAVAFSRQLDGNGEAGKFLTSASQDRTIKLWDVTGLQPGADPEKNTIVKARSLATIKAHEKDINSLDVAPNDRFLASGSQDKLVKIFAIDFSTSSSGASGGLKLLGTCKGHRRGVWTVKFSRTDRVVASGAADRTIKLWSLDDFTCLKTFEGHTNSVLRVDFLSAGQQLITSSTDGLVKLWNIRDEECIKTLDNHEDKIWALAVSSDEKTIVSAGADSVVTFWEDSTEVEQAEKNDVLVAAVKSEQDFTNYLAIKDYRRAILLALAMSQPGRLLTLFRTLLASSSGTTTADSLVAPEVDSIISSLAGPDLIRLLRHVRDWNTNARTSSVAQAVLNSVMRLKSQDQIIAAFNSRLPALDLATEGPEDHPIPKAKKEAMNLREVLDGLIPYSERHFARLERLVQETYVLDYVVSEMDGGMFGGELLDLDARMDSGA